MAERFEYLRVQVSCFLRLLLMSNTVLFIGVKARIET